MGQSERKPKLSVFMAPHLYSLPNLLTMARVLMIPVFVAIAYWPPVIGVDAQRLSASEVFTGESSVRYLVLAVLFVLAALTDWLDGYLARRWNQTSAFGRFLDPVADKLMVAVALLVLVQWHTTLIMVVSAMVIICREITVSALREWMAELGARASVAVSFIGKLKTTMQMVSITVFLLNIEALLPVAHALLVTAVMLTLWSMMIYLKAAWPYLRQP